MILFGIQVEDEDLYYWIEFWSYYAKFLEPLVESIEKTNVTNIGEFKFLVGTVVNSAKIITLNHPKG